VLNRKQTEQAEVYQQRLGEGSPISRINGLRHGDVADETGCIQECAKENQITKNSIRECCYSLRHTILLSGWRWYRVCDCAPEYKRSPDIFEAAVSDM
jgi:hypothetical protein